MGASMYARKSGKCCTLSQLTECIENASDISKPISFLKPLFENEEEYKDFKKRHDKATVKEGDIKSYFGDAFLGIDCGSTTTKLVLISENDEILYSYYSSNKGNPVGIVKEELEKIYSLCEDKIKIKGSAVTGYGEELIKNAFGIDFGLVETIAHYTAAKHFMPQVEFILDIGGQDIKCFRIRNDAIDSIMLNEACSSGCGSFLDTFAKAMGYSISEFAQKGLYGKRPVDLGSRCTVFMNSSVKQSQKEGASVEDISAGLSISVVKNAIYKVIRAGSPDELGKSIVVQGGTFYNDAVLRAFEREIGRNVIRPSTAGLMGAFGAALFSKKSKSSSIISQDALKSFVHTSKPAVCGGCQNRCHLTINTFENGKKFISGNQCEKGAGITKSGPTLPNLFEFKRNYLQELPNGENKLGKIGLPLTLGMYELLPLWKTIFSELGFQVVVSNPSTRKTYEKGQFSIPSDTACYPAKIMHGHIMELLEEKVDAVFYPRVTYNIPEEGTDNHYNCPVVAYYSDLLRGNMDELRKTRFLYPFLNINNEKELSKELKKYLSPIADISLGKIKDAVKKGFIAHNTYRDQVKKAGEKALNYAKTNGKKIMILAGRPYHIDPEICHGIDKLTNSLGFVVVSEDSVYHLAEPQSVNVLNQWSYHSRLYRAAKYASLHSDTELVQLVSFGCGLDAITTDEVRDILEKNGKFYTQLKIDEITNLGAVKIRLRSLSGAIEEREKN
jgi:predicted CoA-substrate-specific enzyme activase